ncbi:DUF4097 family beta strand repeat-containing protein [Ornithinimicrobium cerasi]|uniref:DUF4097 family beta strand repeat-containing protein n=1 Tax=Ornithinimicrobium cerasi TaxID=2248773 RepID=UPI000EFF6C11|nr:DUF4097 family beta strand repeat-containing protein [Ornithinimicrobium cerasi]
MSTVAPPQDTMPGRPAPPVPPRRGGYGVLRAVGVGVTGLLVLGGVMSTAPEMVRRSAEVERAWPAGTTELQIEGHVGQVLVREGTGLDPVIVLEKTWSFREPELRMSTVDGVTRLALDCPVGPAVRCAGDWSVVVPAGEEVAVTVDSSTGDVELDGVSGDVTVTSAVGDVRLTGSPGTADLRSSVGTVTALLTEPPDLLQVESSVGDIDVTLPPDYAYAVRTDADLPEVITDVRQDSGSSYVVDVRSGIGTIRIDDE